MADAKQFEKIRAIVEADESCAAIVVSAPGKRFADDHKVTDLLYLCHAHLRYGVSCDGVYAMIRERFLEIKRDLGLRVDIECALDDLRKIVREEAGTAAAGLLTVEVPVYLDGLQIARASAPHIQTELQRRDQQDARNRGRRTL